MITMFRIMQGLDRVDRGTWFQTVEESRGAGVRTRQDTAGQLTKEPLGQSFKLCPLVPQAGGLEALLLAESGGPKEQPQ